MEVMRRLAQAEICLRVGPRGREGNKWADQLADQNPTDVNLARPGCPTALMPTFDAIYALAKELSMHEGRELKI